MSEGLSSKMKNVEFADLNGPRFNFTEFLNSPIDGIVNEQSFPQLPECNASLESLPIPPSNNIAKQDTSNLDSLLLQGQENEIEDICLDNALSEELFNFEDLPDFNTGDPNVSLTDYWQHCNGLVNNFHTDPLIINSTNPPDQCPPEDTTFYSSMGTGGFPQNQTYMAPDHHHQPGGHEQAMPATMSMEQQQASTSYESNAQVFASSLLHWAMHQPNPQCQSSCQLMRRIIHSNGYRDTKLEIHCVEGQNYHAVLQTRFCNFGNECQPDSSIQMTQFSHGNAEYMKHFLVQYGLLRAKEGYALRHDCVLVNAQMGMGMSIISDQSFPGPLLNLPQQTAGINSGQQSEKSQPNQTQVQSKTLMALLLPKLQKPTKAMFAAQRERTGKLQLSDCADFFHLPINKAAKQMQICPTVLKKICRRNNMFRWPHRKIKSIDRSIANLDKALRKEMGRDHEKKS